MGASGVTGAGGFSQEQKQSRLLRSRAACDGHGMVIEYLVLAHVADKQCAWPELLRLPNSKPEFAIATSSPQTRHPL